MDKKLKKIRSRVVRVDVSDVIYFITTNVQNRASLFSQQKNVVLLRETMRAAQEFHPFIMRGYVFLPDHLHLLIYIPLQTNVSKLMQAIKRNFTRNYKDLYQLDDSLQLWQRSFYDHVIRDERDFLNHLDYIHYNPVKHGLVMRPEDYQHTSYLEYVKRGWYEIGWGHEGFNERDWEIAVTGRMERS